MWYDAPRHGTMWYDAPRRNGGMWYDAPRRIWTVVPVKGTLLLGNVFAPYDAERRTTLCHDAPRRVRELSWQEQSTCWAGVGPTRRGASYHIPPLRRGASCHMVGVQSLLLPQRRFQGLHQLCVIRLYVRCIAGENLAGAADEELLEVPLDGAGGFRVGLLRGQVLV